MPRDARLVPCVTKDKKALEEELNDDEVVCWLVLLGILKHKTAKKDETA